MTITEKIAHLKGLAEGLDIAEEKSKEARLLTAMLEVLEDMSAKLSELEDNIDLVNEELDELSDEIMTLEEDVYCSEDDEDEFHDIEDEDDFEDDGTYYQVQCPQCGEEMVLDEDTLLAGNIRCEACGQLFSLEIVDEDGSADESEDYEEDTED